MGDLVVDSHFLLKLGVGLLNSANLLCGLGVGNHDSSLDLADLFHKCLFQFHLGIGSELLLPTAFSDALADFHILSACAGKVVGATAVLLESCGSGLNGLAVRGGGDDGGSEELYKGEYD